MSEQVFTAVFVKCEGWWAAKIQEISGVNTQGRTIEEARENLRDALKLILDYKRDQMLKDTMGLEVVQEPISTIS